MTEKVRYATVVYIAGEATWFILEKPPAGLPDTTARMKIGAHYYFLVAEPPIIDAASGTTLIFVQAVTHHSLWGNNISPEGTIYELKKIDPHDFRVDSNWREIDNPFSALA